jgi:hypothetical protein
LLDKDNHRPLVAIQEVDTRAHETHTCTRRHVVASSAVALRSWVVLTRHLHLQSDTRHGGIHAARRLEDAFPVSAPMLFREADSGSWNHPHAIAWMKADYSTVRASNRRGDPCWTRKPQRRDTGPTMRHRERSCVVAGEEGLAG